MSSEEAIDIVKRTGLSGEKAIELFKYWYKLNFTENFDEKHAIKIFKIGLSHAKNNVSEKLMILTMGAFIRESLKVIGNELKLAIALNKALMWNLCIMIYSYLYVREKFLKEATGISKNLLERLMTVKSREVYDKIEKTIKLI